MPSMLAGWSWLELVGWLELDGGRSKLSDCWSWMVERSKAGDGRSWLELHGGRSKASEW